MAKEELIQFEGLVTEILPDARYRVQLDAGHEIVAYTAGKMKKNRIKTLASDRVTEPRAGHRRAVSSAAAKAVFEPVSARIRMRDGRRFASPKYIKNKS